ncbi:single-stranded-DNA-specific exonuclease RecJ [Streptococcus ruminantium]|uniref:single-stranded-DNA-specific exonuclease RecJ n=1 Tax=Streptococcus ruminantium TaxID=1917441 RepID=UPI00280F4ABF|nr:single-stranded-DNA-specific exonuclease RecJ [Streptococcus ruminantium]MDQ8759919.1 single-stranded-DNA-specific exonuclease RecJ [Streptococcus ruminantium]MDQ8775046.1 single-stranded-DNA-specific exonuclease RecJ [Streptococcus ruminantium]MDQ8807899.1 single-stranded-DNA-specific exonuclease RecJ [Streptococcus ruminantium]MDQ8816988.1 single-stranded-DNA-specific exonuclease RecJ [Streptococcus ruminantium]MDQ8842939.1 single-stranded-DNA-specific exonuclease RecJ [Streptococcus rumi
MIKPQYDWQLLTSSSSEQFTKLAKKEGLDPVAAKLLYDRGIHTSEDLHTFLHPSLDDLHDPYLLHDMGKAVDRIRRAIEDYEQILIYGDYDADGMTATSILKEVLEELGAEVQVYLPNRFTDGYGPNLSVYKYFIEQQGVSLIVTVDNGVAGHEAIAYAQEKGVDVVVTDHHSLQETLPNAYAIIHPEHPDGSYPFKQLAGCGVAFKLACALLETVHADLLDLVAIGTIADMVSLTDENRVMVKYGLSLLRQTERVGLQELIKIAGIDVASLDEETVGFQLAPRLNALGRLDDPNPAVELLTGFDEEQAYEIALLIDSKNTERKDVVQAIYDEARTMIRSDRPVQVLAREGWNPGVLGIVAGRLLEELQQPVIVLSIEADKAKGSARSTEAIDIFQALKDHQDLFIAFGGHAGAAGMTLEVDKLGVLSETLATYIRENSLDQPSRSPLVLDEELDLEELTMETLKSFGKLAPYGMDNKKPVFYLKDFQVESARTMGQNNAHLKLRVTKGTATFDVVAFGRGNLALEFSQAKQLELAVTLSVNQWNGNTSLQLMLVDARVVGIQLYNIRGKQHPLPTGIPILDLEHPPTDEKAIVLVSLPEEIESLRSYFQKTKFEAVYFKNEMATPYYLDGYGSRDQFARLYKTIHQFDEFDVRYKLKDLASYLKIKDSLLIKMIQIFQELEFVTITNGIMRVNKTAQKKELSESQIYQNLKKTVIQQELMALGTVQEIYDWLCGRG